MQPMITKGPQRAPTPKCRRDFEQSVPLKAAKTVRAVQLPTLGIVTGHNPALHIFAMATG